MKHLRNMFVIILGLFTLSWRNQEPQLAKGDAGVVDSPADLSPKGWKAALLRTKDALKDKNLSMYAASLGYYATLTFFPAALGLATLYTTLAGPQALLNLLNDLSLVLPPAMQDLLDRQLSPLAEASRESLGVATAISLAAVLWTTSGGLQNLIKATNVAYDVEETRGMIKLRLLSVGLSAVFIVFMAIILVLLVLQGDALHALGVPTVLSDLFPIVRWPILIFVVSLVLSVIYRYAPNRREPRWSWVSWGATAATIIWLIGTVLFFFYTQHFGNFNESYGIFASIIILMTWFNLSALIILVGAQVNQKLESVVKTAP